MASTSSDSPRSLSTRLALWGGGLLGGLLVLILAAALIIPQLFTSDQLKGYVIPPMEEATGRTVQIDEIGLRVLWTPAVSVSGFKLANREGYGPEPGVEATQLNVEIALWPLLTGGIEPTAVELVDPVVRYEISKDGSTNFDDLLASDEQAAQEQDGGMSLPISNFRTTGAQVRYEDRSTGQAVHLDFDARLSALLDGDAIESEGTVDIAALRAVLPDVQTDTLTVTDAQIEYDGRTNLTEGRLDLSAFTLQTAPLTLSTTGTVTKLNTSPTLDLTVEAEEADLAQLAAFAPAAAVEGLNPTGALQLKATVKGPLSNAAGTMADLSVEGAGTLSDIGVDYQGTKLLRNVTADIALSKTKAALQSIQGQLLGAFLSGTVAVSDPMGTPKLAVDLKTGDMNLADLAAFAPPEQVKGFNPQGTLQLDVRANGPLSNLDRLTFDGSGTLAGAGADYDGTAMLRDLSARLSFSNNAVSAQSLTGKFLGKPVNGTVTVRQPMGTATVNGKLAGAADLAQLTALADSDESVSGTADYDVSFSGPLDAPDAIRPSGTIRLQKVRYPYESFRHPIEIPNATVKLTGTGLSMNRFSFNTGEQSMALQTTINNLFPISKGLAEKNPAMAVNFTLTADRLDLVQLYPEADASEVTYSDLFAATLSGSKVNGQSPEALANELYGGTELPAFAVDGSIKIATFLNDPQRIDNLAVDVQNRNRRLTLRNLSGTTYDGKLAGSLTLDQRATATSAGASPPGSVLFASTHAGAAPLRTPAPAGSKLDYDITLSGARAGAFLEDWTMLGQAINGTLDLKMTGDTPLSDGFLPSANGLTAKGTSIVVDGGLSPKFGLTSLLANKLGFGPSLFTSFKRFGGPFEIRKGALEMGTWELGSKGKLSGALGLGGRLDLAMTMDVPLSTLQGSKVPGLAGDGGLGSIVQKLTGAKQGSDTIPLKIGIGGTMTNPTVEIIDKDAFKSSLQKMVQEEGLNRIRNLFDRGNQ